MNTISNMSTIVHIPTIFTESFKHYINIRNIIEGQVVQDTKTFQYVV